MTTLTPAGVKGSIRTGSDIAYHADTDCEVPSLSRSVASILCKQTPLHAWTAHPRLNPDYAAKEAAHFDIGSVAHDLLLRGLEAAEVIDADSWRTAAAQDARDAARKAGKVPLLTKDWERVNTMVRVARVQLEQHDADPPMFTDGMAEQTVMWQEAPGVWCRALVDWLRNDRVTIDDYKTTGKSADPRAWTRSMFDNAGDIQAAFYARGVQKLTGVRPTFRFCVQETTPPFALSVITPSADVLELANAKVDTAINIWARCLKANRWPGYGATVVTAELPSWEATQFYTRDLDNEEG